MIYRNHKKRKPKTVKGNVSQYKIDNDTLQGSASSVIKGCSKYFRCCEPRGKNRYYASSYIIKEKSNCH